MKNLFLLITLLFFITGNTLANLKKGDLKKAQRCLFLADKGSKVNNQDNAIDSTTFSLYNQAIEEFKSCIESNHKKKDEIFQGLGVAYYRAPVPLRNLDEAIKYLNEALNIYKQGKQTSYYLDMQAVCYYEIGNVYCLKGDYLEAMHNYQSAVNLSPYYNSSIAMMYWLGLGVNQDINKAMSLYREASIAGKFDWHFIYALDFQKKEYQKDSANIQAINLFMEYIYLVSVNENISKWLPILTKAADLGYPPAQTHLWIVRYKDQDVNDFGLPYLENAIKQSYVPAITEMGASYIMSINGKIKNFSEAERWFKKGAELGDPIAQYKLGLLYYYKNGAFLPSNEYLEMAIFWFNEAHEQGVPDAKFYIDVARKGLSAKIQLQDKIMSSISNIIKSAVKEKSEDVQSNNTKKTIIINADSSTSNGSSNNELNYGNFLNIKRAYDNYVELLMNMKRNPDNFSNRDRLLYQEKMKGIRIDWNNKYKSPIIYKSDLEDWNGLTK